ncbi:MAG: hypothetical protein ACRD26_12270 [Vicinamibacterales bacterium]
MRPALLPRLVEALETERPSPFLDSLGRVMKLAHERGGFVGTLRRHVAEAVTSC